MSRPCCRVTAHTCLVMGLCDSTSFAMTSNTLSLNGRPHLSGSTNTYERTHDQQYLPHTDPLTERNGLANARARCAKRAGAQCSPAPQRWRAKQGEVTKLAQLRRSAPSRTAPVQRKMLPRAIAKSPAQGDQRPNWTWRRNGPRHSADTGPPLQHSWFIRLAAVSGAERPNESQPPELPRCA